MVIAFLKLVTKLLASPLILSFALLFAALIVRNFVGRNKYASRLTLVSLVYLLLCSQYSLSNALLHPLEYLHQPLHVTNERWQSVQLITTPACYYFDFDELPSSSNWPMCSMSRLIHVALMYKTKPIPIAITGGHFLPNQSTGYASHAALFLIQLGVNENDITIIEEGQNTQQEFNALFEAYGNIDIAVVTSATHSYRAKGIANQAGFDSVLPIPVDHLSPPDIEYKLNAPSLDSLINVQRALYEYFAIAYWKISSSE